MESDRVTFFSPNNIITISKQQTLSDSYSQEGMLFSEGKSTEVLVRTADCRNDFLAIQAASVEGQTDRQTDTPYPVSQPHCPLPSPDEPGAVFPPPEASDAGCLPLTLPALLACHQPPPLTGTQVHDRVSG